MLAHMDEPTPSFEEWETYCFTQGCADFNAKPTHHGYNESELRLERFTTFDPRTLAEYISRLFRNPSALAERYTDDQIGDATWFLFGVASEYFHTLRCAGDASEYVRALVCAAVPPDAQIECIASVTTLYAELYHRVCCQHGADPSGCYTNELEVDSAVWMIWDMDCLDAAVLSPKKWPHLIDPCFDVLETILSECRTSTCQMSACTACATSTPTTPTAPSS